MPHVKSCSQMISCLSTTYMLLYTYSLSLHNDPMSDTCHFEYRRKDDQRRSCLRCSVATQANFSSTILITYMSKRHYFSLCEWLKNHCYFFLYTFTSISNTVFVFNTFLYMLSLSYNLIYLTFPPVTFFFHKFTFTPMLPTHSLPSFQFCSVFTCSLSLVII